MLITDKIDRLIAEYEDKNPLCAASSLLLDLSSYQELKMAVYPDIEDGELLIELEVLEYQGLRVGMNNFNYAVVHVS